MGRKVMSYYCRGAALKDTKHPLTKAPELQMITVYNIRERITTIR